jgi:phosphoglycolate phosphatase-like HAD superfamily hydrolase
MMGDALSDLEGARNSSLGFVGIQVGNNMPFPGNTMLLKNLMDSKENLIEI